MQSKINSIEINGYNTQYADCHKEDKNFLLIKIPETAEYSFSDICGCIVANRLIKQVDYKTINNTRYIIAYY